MRNETGYTRTHIELIQLLAYETAALLQVNALDVERRYKTCQKVWDTIKRDDTYGRQSNKLGNKGMENYDLIEHNLKFLRAMYGEVLEKADG